MHLLLFSRDLGGTNQLVALRALLQGCDASSDHTVLPQSMRAGLGLDSVKGGKLDITVVAKDFATRMWARERTTFRDWYELTAKFPAGDSARYVLQSLKPDLLVTATSDVDDRTDVRLWSAARALGIPSAAFVDHGVSLRERFLDEHEQLVLPDRIFLPYQAVMNEMQALCQSPERLILCGDLHALHLPFKAKNLASGAIKRTRHEWGVRDDDVVVLFPSEPRREMALAGRQSDEYEDEGFCALAEYLSQRRRLPGFPNVVSRYTIVVRPHPKDTPGKYHSLVDTCPIHCVIDETAESICSIMSSDVVVGLDSTVLFEADILGRPVYSIAARSFFVERLGRARFIDMNIGGSPNRRIRVETP